ncbi:MAG: DEAD/DEAH box helicase [Erysipelotrichaceae bacterium]|nr:DEAD/DEAH box helicase [Erysipelotrichaceae bacterium]
MSKFSDYMFCEETKQFLALEGFVKPTPIQQQVIPMACKGKDIIGRSDTGTGKTHAFLIPIMEKVKVDMNKVQAVITAPTRELASQIYYRAQKMCEANPKLRVRLIVGGIEKSKMNDSLKVQPHIVIGTPGRIKDLFLNEQTLRVDTASIFVVDEADMTLEFGFLEDIDHIAGKMNSDLQMMSFSATIPMGLKLFLKKYMKEPQYVTICDEPNAHPKIEHVLIPCKHELYEDVLLKLLTMFTPYVCLIFANTRLEASNVAQKMRDHGYGVIELHGDLTARARQKAMKEIRTLEKSYIVATDIAARGIDIDGVTHVVSMGFPKEINFYIHRSGRTARAGKDGICYALYKENELRTINTLHTKGIAFEHRGIKDHTFVELMPLIQKKQKKESPLEKEISKIVHKKKQKVKPGYKVKRKQEIEKLKRRKKREMIKEEIKQQKKERAKAKMREKRGLEE